MPKLTTTCPCGDNMFTITYINEDVKQSDLFCPFCSAPLDDSSEVEEYDSEERVDYNGYDD